MDGQTGGVRQSHTTLPNSLQKLHQARASYACVDLVHMHRGCLFVWSRLCVSVQFLRSQRSRFTVRRMSSESGEGAPSSQLPGQGPKSEKQLRKEAEKLAKKQAKMEKFAKKQEAAKNAVKIESDVCSNAPCLSCPCDGT